MGRRNLAVVAGLSPRSLRGRMKRGLPAVGADLSKLRTVLVNPRFGRPVLGMSLSPWEHSCPNYGRRFAPEAGLMRVSWDSLFGNLFRACPAPLGEGGAKRRVRAGNAPSSGPSGHLLPKGEGHEPRFRLILDTSLTN